MQAIKCEMCNSNDFMKKDGYFICQHCGTKYTVEEAKKLMIEGTVKIDNTDELEKLYIAARNARETTDTETAIKHYEKISSIDPNSWEALFYLVILKTNEIKYGEISNAAISVSNCLPKVFELINTTIQDENEKKEAVEEVKKQCVKTAVFLMKTNGNYYNEVKSVYSGSYDITSAATNLAGKSKAKNEAAERASNISDILLNCGDIINNTFGFEDEFYKNLSVYFWKEAVGVHFAYIKGYKVGVYSDDIIEKYTTLIKKYDPSFEVPNIKPTEKRNVMIASILLIIGAIAAGILWAIWINL